MRKFLIVSASLLGLAIAPAVASTKVVIKPQVDTWVMKQKDSGVTFQGNLVIGEPLPDTVTYVDVPDDPEFAFVVVNKKRVLVEKKTHKIVKIYE